MEKIFGLDLGTNSIGWALRNTALTENQIEKFGVLTFNKGVGLGKTGEYSYAAERTKKRSTRRLYQARKYRLWATLEVLIAKGYCPLSIEDLNMWRHYNKEEACKNNNAGRVYPVWNTAFDAWIKLDFDNDGKPDYTSPYQLRKELAEAKLDFTQESNRFKLGRALYHIAQRRGFKSSRKGADNTLEKETSDNEVMALQYSERKKNKSIAELFEKHPEAKTIGWLFALLENKKIRIRESIAQYAIRENYKDEIKFIFQTQGLGVEHSLYVSMCVVLRTLRNGKEKSYIDGSIFYKRPLRSQKGLVGKCTLEPNKYRAPISHPAFETFRAWTFLNNIKYKPLYNEKKSFKENSHEAKFLPLELKQEIFDRLFIGRLKAYFPFSEIITFLQKKGYRWQLNYSPKTTVSGSPVSARLKDIFGEDWNKLITKKDAKDQSIQILHVDQHGKELGRIPLKQPFYQDIWHVLFSCEDEEFIYTFAKEKLKLSEERPNIKSKSNVEKFVLAWNSLPVGYGMLSLNALNKINPFLQRGLIYTEAVLLANLPQILGEDAWQKKEQLLTESISNIINENRQQKTIILIVNGLISKYKNLSFTDRSGYRDKNYKLDEKDLANIQEEIYDQFGEKKWASLPDSVREEIYNTTKACYQAYFSNQGLIRNSGNTERTITVEAGNKKFFRTESGYYRMPKLIDTLREFLSEKVDHLDPSKLLKIYHPSEINFYPPAREIGGVLKLGSPKTGSFKNPMAMRTLHELRKLMNYMIETNQINSETRIVVEVARDLNDANKRWAIETWQRQREAENQEFAEAIKQLLTEDKNAHANAENNDDIDKVRLFYEQNTEQTLPEVVELEKDEKGKRKKKKSIEKDEIIRWGGHGKKLIDKYRLWKEQGYQCLYTGKYIKLSDLFNENVIDFEHTVPRSKSFDNSLLNLTVCYHDYNRTIKKNQIPTQLLNYDKEYDFGGSIGKCSAITSRLDAWKEKIERIKQQIDFWKTKSKKAADKSWKDDAIRQRLLWQMELDYWQTKLNRFTITEITSSFKNSQKVDTQLISKYAFHYLKSYFDKVDVQKGSITAEFRKIYQLQAATEKKDRTKHSHHAKDAAVLTLIPVSTKRDAILENYYKALENNMDFHAEPPFRGFKREFVWGIDDTVLINNITNNQALTPAKRKVRKRGKEVFIEKSDGTKVNMWATGDCIRGQLHQETFYGAIAQRGKDGNLLKDKNDKVILKYVLRIPFNSDFTSVDKIVDEGLKMQIQEHIKRAGSFKKAFAEGIYLLDKYGKPHGNKIRHIRTYSNVSEPLAIKKQTNLSDKEYKQNYWAANGENFAYAVYENTQKQRGFRLVSLYNVAKLKKTFNVLKEMFEQEITTQKPKTKVQLKYVLTSGLKVLFYQNDLIELQDLVNDKKQISNRLYVIDGFEKDGRIRFSHNLDSRSIDDLKKLETIFGKGYWQGFSQVQFDTPVPKLKLSKDSLNMAVEGYDFTVEMDGEIKWL